MTNNDPNPQERIADAFSDIAETAANLVQLVMYGAIVLLLIHWGLI